MSSKHKLQALRIPAGWSIGWNTFTEVDPQSMKNTTSDRCYEYEFDEDMFQATSTYLNLTIDLGWYPSYHSNGSFVLVLIKELRWDQPLKTIKTRDKSKIVTAIENWMIAPI
jgi:hypothetical protein